MPLPGIKAALALMWAAAAMGDQVTTPLTVVSITPTSEAAAYQLFQTDSLTVVFSRPVVALGADFANSPSQSQAPFQLVCTNPQVCDLPGNFQWVSTSIGRFTPNDTWAPDLSFDLIVDPSLTAFDGTPLTADAGQSLSQSYYTYSLEMILVSISSNVSSELTEGRWQSTVAPEFLGGGSGTLHEVPPDGVIQLQLSYQPDLDLLKDSLQLLPVCKLGTQCKVSPIPVAVSFSTASQSISSYYKMTYYGPTYSSQDNTLVDVVPSQPLAYNTNYTLGLPMGARYSKAAGAVSKSTTVALIGLLPFMVPLTKPWNGMYSRFRFGLMHGLSADTTLDALKAAMDISPMPAGGVTLKQVAKAVVEVEGQATPNTTYVLSLRPSDDVKDGYGQSLLGSSVSIRMDAVPEQVTYAKSQSGTSDARFEPGFGTTQSTAVSNGQQVAVSGWGVLSINVDLANCLGSKQQKMVTGTSVTQDNLDALIKSTVSSSQGVASAKAVTVPSTQEIVLGTGTNSTANTVAYQELDAQTLLRPSGLALLRYWENLYQGDQGACLWYPRSQWLSSTDINPVFVAYPGKVFAWVTRFSDAQPLANAQVLVYTSPDSYYSMGSVSLLAEGITDADGMATIPIEVKDYNGVEAFVITNSTMTHATISTVPKSQEATQSTPTGTLVVDRKMYKKGDTVYVKGYVRQHKGGLVTIPSDATLAVRVSWAESGQTEDIPVTMDPTYGDFNTTLVLPSNISAGYYQILIVCKSCESDSGLYYEDPTYMGGTDMAVESVDGNSAILAADLPTVTPDTPVDTIDLPMGTPLDQEEEEEEMEGLVTTLDMPETPEDIIDLPIEEFVQPEEEEALATSNDMPTESQSDMPEDTADESPVSEDLTEDLPLFIDTDDWVMEEVGGLPLAEASETQTGEQPASETVVPSGAGIITPEGLYVPGTVEAGEDWVDTITAYAVSNAESAPVVPQRQVIRVPARIGTQSTVVMPAALNRVARQARVVKGIAALTDSQKGVIIASESIVVADPRIPTGILKMETGLEVYRPGQTLPVTITTTTYTGAPVPEAKVAIRWSLVGMPYGTTQTDGSNGELSGEMEVVTGEDGTARTTVAIGYSNPPVFATVNLRAEWMGPTGELLQETADLLVAYSALTIDANPTVYSPLPGTRMAFFITVRDKSYNAIANQAVTATVYAYGGKENIKQVSPQGAVTGVGAEVSSTSCTAMGNGQPVCQMAVPNQVGKFAIVFTVTDSEGYLATTNIIVGKTAEEWQNDPLNYVPDPVVVSDRENYTMGSTASLLWYNPYAHIRVLVLWGNGEIMRNNILDIDQTGEVSVPVPIGEECSGKCRVAMVAVAPRREAQDTVLPAGVVVSPLLDLEAPTSFTYDSSLTVVDPTVDLTVSVDVAEDPAAPGSDTEIQVTVNDAMGEPTGATVCVAVVNKAYLDLMPLPVAYLQGLLKSNTWLDMSISTPGKSLASMQGYDKAREILWRRMTKDPYVHDEWHLLGQDDWGKAFGISDEKYFDQYYTSLMSSFDLSSSGNNFPGLSTGGSTEYAREEATSDSMSVEAPKAAVPSPMTMLPPTVGFATNEVADADMVQTALASGDEGGAVTLASTDILRSNFVVTPLWVASAIAGPDGKVTLPFTLPDNVGQYSIRAYAVGPNNAFGVGQKTFRARNPVATLETKMPRIARLGDVFDGGVTVTMTDTAFRGTVLVTMARSVQASEGQSPVLPLCNSAPSTTTVEITRSGPVSALFRFCAQGQGEASLQFSVIVEGSATVADAVAHNISVLGWQEPVDLATSTALNAANANPWPEAVVIPAAVPNSGTLAIAAGVGSLPAVLSLNAAIVADNAWKSPQLGLRTVSNIEGPEASGMDLVSLMAPVGALATYGQGVNTLQVAALTASSKALDMLEPYTVANHGLLWYPPEGTITTPYGDAWLNAYALYLAKRGDVTTPLADLWEQGLVASLEAAAQEASKNQGSFSDWRSLAWAYLVLGTGYNFSTPDLSFSKLVANIPNTELGPAVVVSMALTSEGQGDAALVANTTARLANTIRIQGRTAYFAEEGASTGVYATNALALSFLSKRRAEGISDRVPTLDKVATYVAQQGRLDADSSEGDDVIPLWMGQLTNNQRALALLGLADYDQQAGSAVPDLSLSVMAGNSTELLSAKFDQTNLGAPVEKTWGFGGLSNTSIQFYAQGTGEASVVMAMNFVPASLPTEAVMHGIAVTKTIQLLNTANNTAVGPPITNTTALQPGTFVSVSIKVTTADSLSNVYVVDGLPGGLEALDSNIYQNAPADKDVEGSSGSSWWWQAFERKEVLADKVTFFEPRLSPGTQVLTYTAMVVTPGGFTVPPTKAYCAEAAEVMGLTPGGWLVVTDTYLGLNRASRQRVGMSQPLQELDTAMQ